MPAAQELSAFVAAVVDGAPAAVARAGDDVAAAVGRPGMIDTAAVLANFEMMTRIADGTGARHEVGATSDVPEIGGLTGADGFESAR